MSSCHSRQKQRGVSTGKSVQHPVLSTSDRLGRSLKDLIETLNLLKNRGVDFISLTENIDTTTPGGKLIFHLMGDLAEFERDLIRERTNAGLVAARARGRVGGRPRKLSTNGKVALALRLFEDPNHSVDDICSTLGISRSTFYRYVREAKKMASSSNA
ncbi:MAG: recombinase family protein [Ktedonobacteraceae bacterium]